MERRNKMSIILMVDGGFASQLNKYFVGQFLEKKFKTEVKYDLSWFDRFGKSTDGKDTRNFELLKIFPDIKFPIASREEIEFYKANYYYVNEQPFVYDEVLLQKTPPLYLNGYFCHWKYLPECDYTGLEFNLALDEKNLKNLEAIEKADSSVAVHIRRGDYVGSVHDTLTAEYFINAILHMQKELGKKKPKFFIFSTEMSWVEKNILSRLPKDIKYQTISNNVNSAGVYDFYLISKCKHQICSNSGFSYFGAFLNKYPQKQVIIPDEWMNQGKDQAWENQNKALRLPDLIVMSNGGIIVQDNINKKPMEIKTAGKREDSKNPKISVLCPAYNHEKYVKYFIESVLTQTEQNFELIIVDDCSSDKTVEEIEKFSDSRIKLLKHDYNKGINAGVNDAFKEAKGQYCVLIASDDILAPNHLKVSTGYLDKNPNIGVFYSSLKPIDENNMPIDDPQNSYWRCSSDRFDLLKQMFFWHNPLFSPGMVIRSEVFAKIMPLSLSTLQYQDYQINVKLLLNNEIYQSQNKLVNYRRPSDNQNISSNTSLTLKRQELEEYKLMDSFLNIMDLELLNNIFKAEIAHTGSPTLDTIPYFLGIMAFSSPIEIRKNWGYHTIMNFIEKEENLDLLYKFYKFDFKSYLDLANSLDLNNSFGSHQLLTKRLQEYEGNLV